MRSTINVYLFVIVGNAFCFLSSLLAVYWSCIWFRLLFVCSLYSRIFCFNLYNFVAGFSLVFFSEIILDICELILSLLGICVIMQCNDAITCVLASPSLLPFRGNQVQGTLYWKKLCKRDDSSSKVPLWLSRMLPVDQ